MELRYPPKAYTMTKTSPSEVQALSEINLSPFGTGPTYTMGPAVDHIRFGDKFIDEYSTEELEKAYIEHLGPCWICGIDNCMDADDDRDFLVEFWTGDRELELHQNKTNRILDRMARGTACRACREMREEEQHLLFREATVSRRRARLQRLRIIPTELTRCCFGNSESEIMKLYPDLWMWARNWTPKSESAWIYGDKGTGKTFFARCILNAQLDKGVSVGELSAVEFNRVARRKFYNWDEQRKVYGEVKCLLIEDIDKAIWTPDGLSELFSLLDERYDNHRRCLITTNATVEYCESLWTNAIPENPSMPGTILDRMQPIRRIEMVGKSLRQGVQGDIP